MDLNKNNNSLLDEIADSGTKSGGGNNRENAIRKQQCPVCGNGCFHTFRFSLLRCMRCGLIMNSAIFRTKSNEEFQGRFFDNKYDETSFWTKSIEAWNNYWTGKRILRLKLKNKKTLEIGPGSGSFMFWLLKHGFEVQGCDLSSTICKHLWNLGLNVHYGHISDIKESHFDLTIAKHVLEHVNNPLSFLQDIKKRLRDCGTAYISVPNISCWEAKLSGWNSYEPYHLSYFSRKTLSYAARRAGLKIESIETKESFSGWFLALLRTLTQFDRTKYSKSGIIYEKRLWIIEFGYRIAMIVAGILTYPMRKLQSALGYGDEIILIAQREFNEL